MRYVIALLFCSYIAFAQPYGIHFASKGNAIELSVSNTTNLIAEGVKVELSDAPEGIKFTEKSVILQSLKGKDEQTASFKFSVEKTAILDKEQTITFTITDNTGQSWTKDIKVVVKPPLTYELFQNYPNPFNSTTTIEYQLPGTGAKYSVSLKIYDIIGREVAVLANEQQVPGYYQKTFNASNYASGIYIYQLIAVDAQNYKHVFRKKNGSAALIYCQYQRDKTVE
jgi:hypothetical protein